MRRFVNVAGATVTAVGIAVLLSGEVAAQSASARGAAARTPWGTPDLQGLWNVGTMTPVERPASAKGRLTMAPEEARVYRPKVVRVDAKNRVISASSDPEKPGPVLDSIGLLD